MIAARHFWTFRNRMAVSSLLEFLRLVAAPDQSAVGFVGIGNLGQAVLQAVQKVE